MQRFKPLQIGELWNHQRLFAVQWMRIIAHCSYKDYVKEFVISEHIKLLKLFVAFYHSVRINTTFIENSNDHFKTWQM